MVFFLLTLNNFALESQWLENYVALNTGKIGPHREQRELHINNYFLSVKIKLLSHLIKAIDMYHTVVFVFVVLYLWHRATKMYESGGKLVSDF